MEKRRVLVVHSEPDFVKTAIEALGSSYEVSIASTRKEGLKKANREIFDVVIVGLLQPMGDAFRLYKELQENPVTKNIPLLIADVSPEEHARKAWRTKEGIQRDAEEYISCPVQPTHLAETVRHILGKGFNVPQTIGDLARDGKLGLAGMQERARLVGGTLTVQSQPGRGTYLTVELLA